MDSPELRAGLFKEAEAHSKHVEKSKGRCLLSADMVEFDGTNKKNTQIEVSMWKKSCSGVSLSTLVQLAVLLVSL